ncbi:uncharacterized protein A4U43_C03F15020 [Asparagus officinalis]|uniref:Hexosyltransferase n=1 Tax=Asparagus officinalis TaxID=4686 RepID=A0A5P1FFC7_ASPOF|nr:uncharacterized protein A4U43_C03F15020 [Asparagus officinalis]
MASSPVATSLFLLLLISSSVAIRPSPDLLDKPTSQVSALLRSFSRAPTPRTPAATAAPRPHRRRHDPGLQLPARPRLLRRLISSPTLLALQPPLHFLASPERRRGRRQHTAALLEFIFPWLSFRISTFEQKAVQALVERKLAHDSLSYARAYLADVLPSSVDKVIYLSPDVIVLDDVLNLWNAGFRHDSSVVAAPRYCAAKERCYFKTGVMVVDLGRWREGGYSGRVEELMARMQKGEWVYDPVVAAFGGAAEGIDERWDRVESDLDGDCKVAHGEGEVSLVHWSAVEPTRGGGCEVKLWAQYDLHRS